MCPLIQGRKFLELSQLIQKQIERYTLTIVVLPKNLELHLRLEIFRRINEGGMPLSPHDLRLAIFAESIRVYLIRLAGIFDQEREGARRMIEAAQKKFDLNYPWKNPSAWKDWWSDKAQATGQVPSQMFLYYVIARDRKQVQILLDSEKTHQSLGLKYDRTTISVLDLYCAQAQSEDKPDPPKIVADLLTLQRWFEDFELWFNEIKTAKIPRISVNSSTKVALFIAAAAEIWRNPDEVSERQWELIQVFLTQGPNRIQEVIGIEYPSTRGKWPGQKKQIEQTFEICRAIAQR